MCSLAVEPIKTQPSDNDLATSSKDDIARIDQSIQKSFESWQYDQVIASYEKLLPSQKTDPAICYRVGYSFMRVHDFISAEVPLRTAEACGFTGFPDYPTVSSLIERVEELKKLRPPLYPVKARLPFKLFARSTEWIKSVEGDFPQYQKRAREIFGEQLPPVSFYIFEDRNDYRRFYKALFEWEPSKGQDATGVRNVVVGCEKTSDGRALATHRINWRKGVLLHEYCHALCNTIYGTGFTKNVPEWFDEGVADFMAEPYYHSLFRWYRENLVTAGKTVPAPTYESMISKVQDDREVRYAIALEMVLELVARRKHDLVRHIIMQAKSFNGDFEKAIVTATGIEARRAYETVIMRYWKSGPILHEPSKSK